MGFNQRFLKEPRGSFKRNPCRVMDLHYLHAMPATLETLEIEAALTTQDQITVPATVRKTLALQGGKSRVLFRYRPDEGVFVFTRAKSPARNSKDPALGPFLRLLEQDIQHHPGRLAPVSAKLLKKARALVKGVKIDLDGPLTGED
jgi:antitoxin PrlF